MEFAGMLVALLIGVGIGYVIGSKMAGGGSNDAASPDQAPVPVEPNWWEVRQQLTGTQLEILQYMEAKKEAPITALQEKFSAIPDRELYYRLEQIVLMKFLTRQRKDGEVCYVLNPEYSGTVEEDKTVFLGE